MQYPDPKKYLQLIQLAYDEDYAGSDVTSEATISEGQCGRGALVFRKEGIVCGMPVVQQVLSVYSEHLQLEVIHPDGTMVGPGTTVATLVGPMRSLLAAERVVLNFLQRLSAIATMTARYVQKVKHSNCQVCDTRKTTPGWRELEKYAVRCGGGINHRYGLWDAVLIKDNHLASFSTGDLSLALSKVVGRVAKATRKPDFIQVEVDTLDQLKATLAVEGVNMILLDNMTNDQLKKAVSLRDSLSSRQKVLLEASGNITLKTLSAIAETGVDRVSIGALTHSVRNLDIALDI